MRKDKRIFLPPIFCYHDGKKHNFTPIYILCEIFLLFDFLVIHL
jgi:hypothetical protein